VAAALLGGAAEGGEYALLVLGFVLIWSATRIISLAQGSVALIGGYLACWLQVTLGVPVLAGLAVVTVLLFSLGYVVGHAGVPALRRRPGFVVLLVTFGLGLILQGLLALSGTNRYHSLAPVTGAVVRGVASGNLASLAVVVGCVDCCALGVALSRGRLGRVMAAVGGDRETAQTLGIRARRVESLAVGLGCACAGAAGVLAGVTGAFRPADASRYTLICVFVAIAVGMSSPLRAVAAAGVVGVADAAARHLIGTTAAVTIEICLLVLVLLMRGAGLLPADEALNESGGLVR
jgi:branched-chain amino acid transport system permease protein